MILKTYYTTREQIPQTPEITAFSADFSQEFHIRFLTESHTDLI